MDAAQQVLPFEKPIAELRQKLVKLREKAEGNPKLDFANEVALLERRVEQKTREIYGALKPWDLVRVARHQGRPVFVDYLQYIFKDFQELHGDRTFSDDRALSVGFATIEDQKVLLMGHRKGKTTKERMEANFGMAHPEGYRKALRAMKLAEKFGLPVVALINTPGAYPGIGAEERGQSQAIAVNLFEMSRLRTPIVCTVIGEGGSGGALGIGVGDRILIQEYAYYSVISPEGCAAILWKDKDGSKAPDAATALKLTPKDLLAHGLVDEVVQEPLGGAHRDPERAAAMLRPVLLRHVRELLTLAPDVLLEKRYEKLRAYGRSGLTGLDSELSA